MVDQEVPFVSKKRILLIGSILILICISLLGRLFFIQIIKKDEYSKKAVQQRLMTIPLDIERGDIFDKNMIPFTGREIKKYIIVYPDYIQDNNAVASVISKLSGTSYEDALKELDSDADTLEFIYEKENKELLDLIEAGKLKGVIAIEKS